MDFGRSRKGVILLLMLYMDTVAAFWLPHLLTEHSGKSPALSSAVSCMLSVRGRCSKL